MILLDGSYGEGGGQILRTALALSVCTGQPFRLDAIRAGRAKPGLLRQHLTAVQAAAAICDASVDGAALGARTITFRPGRARAGDHTFAIATAGSANLVLQTVLPPLLQAGGPSHLTLRGGTHNPSAPPWHFLAKTFLPLLNQMGPKVETSLVRWGFYPAGGGELTVTIHPGALHPLELLTRGPVQRWFATAVVAGGVPEHVGVRELAELRRRLDLPREAGRVLRVESQGPGNCLLVEAETPELCEVFCGFGARGSSAEEVAGALATEVDAWRRQDAPVGEHLADQMLLPLALAGGGAFRASALTEHTRTNAATIMRFLPVRIDLHPEGAGGRVEVHAR